MRYIVVIVILVAVALLIAFRKQLSDLVSGPTPASIPPGGGTGGSTPSTATGLDYTKILKRGSTGAEVKMLQYQLGVTQDGDFGPKTEAALLAKKGVKEITLYSYFISSDVNAAAPNSGLEWHSFYNLFV